mmetsp:Transcript_6859/g.6798  ORF Transcript_6859/g.6798 Transcript_6859/m.6798 type:complete len:415 (-) Transcript_6859:973-2217(-)
MLQLSISYIVVLSLLTRIGFFVFGLYQDKYMTVKYTDIDYVVFSDAAKYVYEGYSPYLRETYRYTPLLAWMLIPNCWGGQWVNFGKYIFMISDLITGIIILRLLSGISISGKKLSTNKVIILSSIWLLNPMVITISTRGSSESVLTVMIMLSLYYLIIKKSIIASGFWLGLSIHFKIYPVIYLPSIMLYLANSGTPFIDMPIVKWVNRTNVKFLITTLITIGIFNGLMYSIYGFEFLYNSYLYHLIRIDHRHNFSVFNVALYYKSAISEITESSLSFYFGNMEKFVMIPQLSISALILPLLFARRDLISCIFVQTFAFVTSNKVITSQYFIWFLIFLPHYLAKSKLCSQNHMLKGILSLLLWIISQGSWLYFAYQLEFLGISTFDNGLIFSSFFFYLSNCWILSVFIDDLNNIL